MRGIALMEYTGHCTGLDQFEKLKETMSGRLFYLSAGASVEI